ncbi:PI-PLC X domain-containing protein 1-like [Stegastes partitus]|uniref:PI-PLC X domain-containing protein 1-like n=1 Tax=Stegastes partitus TaxID=144197 RepID=A0A3B5AXZ8_9TELE|nr:PREDICTED: PI-PLC X domain-containing protein 1-like [Stegastes partitus]
MPARKGKGKEAMSDWMSQLPPELHTVALYDLTLPGSHDSMSYDLDINSSIIEPDGLRRFSKIYCVRKIVRKWAITQEATITKQLDAGVRYLDLRIARKPNDTDPTRLYFYHGLYTRTDVETVLKDIKDWAEGHPKEIVILSLSNFKGFDKKNEKQLHTHLLNFIKTLFGAKLVYTWEKPTLKGCWDQGRNVIVSYDYRAHKHNDIWKKINYYYGNSMDPAIIEAKLCQVLEKERPVQHFFVCGLNLTLPHDARILKYVLRMCDNLVNVIQRSLPKLLRWVKQQSCKTPMNIVASDLVTRNNFVSTIVELNSKKAKA